MKPIIKKVKKHFGQRYCHKYLFNYLSILWFYRIYSKNAINLFHLQGCNNLNTIIIIQ